MLVMDHGYQYFNIVNIPFGKKINKAIGRDVFVVGDKCYKLFNDRQGPAQVFDNIITGFYKKSSPHLLGIVFNEEHPCGYVTQKCNLHVNRVDIREMRVILKALMLETGLGVHDFHLQNIGKLGKRVCFLDLEAVRPAFIGMNSKDMGYNQFVDIWLK